MAADVFQGGPDVRSGAEIFALHRRPDVTVENVPGRGGVFGTVEGIFASGAFAPANRAVDVGFDQDDAAFADAIHAGFERVQQLQMNFAKCQGMDAHFCR